jgi:hypothetical protein
MRQPVSASSEKTQHFTLSVQDELAELSSNGTLQVEFWNRNVCGFWLTVRNEYLVVVELAISVILPFARPYLLESAFSVLTFLKSKYRTHLANVEVSLRAALSDIEPRFDLLCSNMQGYPSH